MPLLDLITILCVGLMTGNELAVSAFFNPAVAKLQATSRAEALSLLARSLGTVMPVWYAICLILLIAEVYMRRHTSQVYLLQVSLAIWILTIAFTVTTLVPINNRIVKLDPNSLSQNWQNEHRRWDRLHRLRVMMLTIATALFVWSVKTGI